MLFCITANYTAAAIAAMRGGEKKANRQEAVEKLVTEAGGKLEAFYGTIQEGPGSLLIIDIDDSTELAALVETISGTGALRNITVTALLPIDEVTEAREKAGKLQSSYTTPGQ